MAAIHRVVAGRDRDESSGMATAEAVSTIVRKDNLVCYQT